MNSKTFHLMEKEYVSEKVPTGHYCWIQIRINPMLCHLYTKKKGLSVQESSSLKETVFVSLTLVELLNF